MPRAPDRSSPGVAVTALGAVVLCCAGPLLLPLLAGLGALGLPLLPAGGVALAAFGAGLMLWRHRHCRERAGDATSRATGQLAGRE